ncbi:MAG: sugar phosphate isomerase/epimerase [Capsulimonadaceae bacterium]|nr:sugar phosphate isomerase/epimerase [Capsulimonadaceae bacterium]
MQSNGIPLGIQSWCFRGSKTNDEVIARLKSCGLNGIELCGVHVDFNKPADVAAAVAAYKAAGVSILSSGVNNLSGDVNKDRPLFEFLKTAGARYMSITFSPATDKDALGRMQALAEEYDVYLGIHNHGGCHWLGSPEILRHIFSITGKRVGLWLDTAWALDAGANPIAMAKEFGERLYGLHIKDFTFDTARRPTDVVIGTGNLDLNALKATLDEVNFNGCAVIEYEGDVDNPVPALTECVVKLRKAFGK